MRTSRLPPLRLCPTSGFFAILVLPTALFAQTVFHDTFASGRNANEHGWFFRGESLVTGEGSVENGCLFLANDGNAPANVSGVWKQFPEVTIPDKEMLRVTVRISAIETTQLGYGLTFALVNSPNPIQADGPLLRNDGGAGFPRFCYVLKLPRANAPGGNNDPADNSFGYFQAYALSATDPAEKASLLTDSGVGAAAAPDESSVILPVVASRRKFFTNGHYAEAATLVWEIRNINGKIVFSGRFTPPDGGEPVEFLEQNAEKFQQTTFNKFYIGSEFWGVEAGDLSGVFIDEVKIELIDSIPQGSGSE